LCGSIEGVLSGNDIVVIKGDLAALLSFPGLMVLKPIENILALYLTIKAELSGDLLNLVSAWSAEP